VRPAKQKRAVRLRPKLPEFPKLSLQPKPLDFLRSSLPRKPLRLRLAAALRNPLVDAVSRLLVVKNLPVAVENPSLVRRQVRAALHNGMPRPSEARLE